METIVVSCLQEIQTAPVLQENDINILLEKMKGTILTAFQAHGETEHCNVLYFSPIPTETSNLSHTRTAVQSGCYFSITMHGCIQQQ